MYIEVIYDRSGSIKACCCADTLPTGGGAMFRRGNPDDSLTHARVNVDTLTAIEIEESSGAKAVVGTDGRPRVVHVERAAYIMENFEVDLLADAGAEGFRRIRRKAGGGNG